jgi:hypothetical protein
MNTSMAGGLIHVSDVYHTCGSEVSKVMASEQANLLVKNEGKYFEICHHPENILSYKGFKSVQSCAQEEKEQFLCMGVTLNGVMHPTCIAPSFCYKLGTPAKTT